jgi:hypothetical protein
MCGRLRGVWRSGRAGDTGGREVSETSRSIAHHMGPRRPWELLGVVIHSVHRRRTAIVRAEEYTPRYRKPAAEGTVNLLASGLGRTGTPDFCASPTRPRQFLSSMDMAAKRDGQ